MEHGLCIFSSGAAHKDFAFVFAVEVQQDISGHETFFKSFSSGQASFFVNSEQTFDRSVFDIVGSQDSQFGGNTDTIVGSCLLYTSS